MRILIADDDAVSRRLVEKAVVQWGYEAVVTSDGFAARTILQNEGSMNLAVLGWRMPGVDGVEICRELRDRQQPPQPYILLVTGDRANQHILEGLEAGADDYLAKPFDAETLRVRLRAGRRIVELQQHLLSMDQAARSPAVYDALTGLWNREVTLDLLRRALAGDRLAAGRVSVVRVDVDRFQNVKNVYGHRLADAVLRETARKIAAGVRFTDSVGRCADGHFLVILPEADAPSARACAQRILTLVSKEAADVIGAAIPVTASVGVATAADTFVTDADSLVRAADIAVREAASRGGNQIRLADRQE
ncbi:MAG TPA: diguanylate cyclase [Terriglobales bacterium]|nr:diguanylate cyclase [Terriglobales bacterium]